MTKGIGIGSWRGTTTC